MSGHWYVNNKRCNLPVYVDTRCRPHIELPAKRHILRMQQTPGIHWGTPSLREKETHKKTAQGISAFKVTSVLFQFTDKPVRNKVWQSSAFQEKNNWRYNQEQRALLPSFTHSSLSFGICHQSDTMKQEWGGDDITAVKQHRTHVLSMY